LDTDRPIDGRFFGQVSESRDLEALIGLLQENCTMTLFSLDELETATTIVRGFVPQTPAYAWPLLRQRLGIEVIVKHENHTPTGSFKARGGLVYVEALQRRVRPINGLVTATRGNHGQSIAVAARRSGLPCIVVVPEGNSSEKNAAMQAFGAELVTAGNDFDESRAVAAGIERDHGYHLIPAFHRDLAKGVATYAHELLTAWSDLDTVYVPIGMGTGICGLITVRNLLGLSTEIVGVVADNAAAFALSFEAGHPVSTASATTFADGMACRDPQSEPLDIIKKGAARIVRVSEHEIAEAVRIIYTDTHNVAEGAGAAALAALIKEREQQAGKRVAVIQSGGNIDMSALQQILGGKTPAV
jgi:threonine dehydratase